MQAHDFITLTIALAALLTSGVVAFETVRQRRNAVRPVLVVLDKANGDGTRTLYLVNMGQGVAVNIDVWWHPLELPGGTLHVPRLREVAPGRRAKLLSGYSEVVGQRGALVAHCCDVDGKKYTTTLAGGVHRFARGSAPPPHGMVAI